MVTIMIPTMNRSDFLVRLLHYYANTGYKHWIYIGDSSNSYHIERTKSAIRKLEGKLKIVYHQYPGLSDYACLKNLLEMVTTPYAVYIGDDDFLIPRGLEYCIEFLQNHKEYVGANGRAILFSLKESGARGEFCAVGKYKQKAMEANTAAGRLLEYFLDAFVPQFSVQRTIVWKKMYKDVLSGSDRAFMGEILPCCLSVIQGKIRHLNCFYLLRQAHERQYPLPDIYDWTTSSDWFQSYQIFHDSLVKALIEQDGIDEEEAHQVVKKAFWSYMNSALNNGFQQQYNLPRYSRIKEYIKRIPPLAAFARKIKSSMFFSGNVLPAFLSYRSPYHEDFMQVYRAVTIESRKL